MEINKYSIKNLLENSETLTFLVGAGCSVHPPSCLTLERTTMNAIIENICHTSQIEKIKDLKNLRFEALMEILRNTIDNELKVLTTM